MQFLETIWAKHVMFFIVVQIVKSRGDAKVCEDPPKLIFFYKQDKYKKYIYRTSHILWNERVLHGLQKEK